jgi:hypothetical protein
VVEEAIAHQLALRRRKPDQVHLLVCTQRNRDPNQIPRHFPWQKKYYSIAIPPGAMSLHERETRTSFSSLRLRVPARKVVEPASARMSAIHRACKSRESRKRLRQVVQECFRRRCLLACLLAWYLRPPYTMPLDPPCIFSRALDPPGDAADRSLPPPRRKRPREQAAAFYTSTRRTKSTISPVKT